MQGVRVRRGIERKKVTCTRAAAATAFITVGNGGLTPCSVSESGNFVDDRGLSERAHVYKTRRDNRKPEPRRRRPSPRTCRRAGGRQRQRRERRGVCSRICTLPRREDRTVASQAGRGPPGPAGLSRTDPATEPTCPVAGAPASAPAPSACGATGPVHLSSPAPAAPRCLPRRACTRGAPEAGGGRPLSPTPPHPAQAAGSAFCLPPHSQSKPSAAIRRVQRAELWVRGSVVRAPERPVAWCPLPVAVRVTLSKAFPHFYSQSPTSPSFLPNLAAEPPTGLP